MDDFDDTWQATEVRAVSPNEQVFLTLVGDHTITVSFAPGYYERASSASIAGQLSALGRRALSERTRAFFRLRSLESGREERPRTEPVTENEGRYLDAMAKLATAGSSADGEVRIDSIGLREFAVTFSPALIERAGAETFAAQVSQAATALLADQMAKVAELKYAIYYKPYEDA